MDEQRPWTRLFGLSWTDFFRGQPVTVEMEKDLSLKKQLLDVLLFHKQPGSITRRLPDGFDDLATYNLVTFKSYQETLDDWAMNELIGHYVNCRKQVSPDRDNLLPESDFRLFAVSVRYPQNLAKHLTRLRQGVYEVQHFTGSIRVVAIHQLPQEEQNAMLHLFSANADQVRYGAQHYRPQSSETSTLLYQLFQRYRLEVHLMPDVMQEFVRETIDLILKETPPEKLLEYLSVKQRLEGLPAEKRLEGIPPEKRLEGLSKEELLQLQEVLTRRLKTNGSSAQPE